MSLAESEAVKLRQCQFKPTHIDSLDARAIQYKYALVKISLFISALNRMISTEAKLQDAPNLLYLVNYMSFCISHMFSINESGFAPKLSALEAFKAPKVSTVTVSAVVTHVPYDGKDFPVNSLVELPLAGKSFLCLKALRAMCINCLEGYQKRYKNACAEIENTAYINDFDYLFEKELFGECSDLDLSLLSKSLPMRPFITQLEPDLLKDSDYEEAKLIDLDLSALFVFIYDISATIADLSIPIEQLAAVKRAPKATQEAAFLSIANKEYSLHRLLFWAMRLNDLYLVARKFIRQVYYCNLEHLNDRKFLSFIPNGQYFQKQLQEINEICSTAKKNGILVATITRFVRSNSKHAVTAKICLEFIGFVFQFLNYFEKTLLLLKSFATLWLSGELAFRESHNLYVRDLLQLLKAVQDTPKTKLDKMRLKQAAEREKEREEVQVIRRKLMMPPKRNSYMLTKKSPSPPKEERATPETSKKDKAVNRYKAEPGEDQESTQERRERTSTSTLASPVSFTEDILRSLPEVSKPLSPVRLTLHKTSSTSSLPGAIKPLEKVAVNANRARSSSLPLSFSAAYLAAKTDNAEKAKAAGNLKRQNSANNGAVRLPISQVADKPENEEPEKATKKLSASQKLQQHLQEASRAGTLYGKERETLTSVVFDPNNPSASNIKRSSKLYTKQPSESDSGNNNVSPSSKLGNSTLLRSSSTKLSSSAAATATRSQLEKRFEPTSQSKNPKSIAQQQMNDKSEGQTKSSTEKSEVNDNTTEEQAQAPPARPTRAQITKHNTHRNSVLIKFQEQSVSTTPSSQESASNSSSVSESTSSTKRVRFTGVSAWTPAEDAPTHHSKRILKNFASITFSSLAHSAFKQKDHLFKKEESISFKTQLNASESSTATQTFAASYTLRFASFRNKKGK